MSFQECPEQVLSLLRTTKADIWDLVGLKYVFATDGICGLEHVGTITGIDHVGEAMKIDVSNKDISSIRTIPNNYQWKIIYTDGRTSFGVLRIIGRRG